MNGGNKMERELKILKAQCMNIIKDEMIHLEKKPVNKEELLKRTEELFKFLKENKFQETL